MCEINFEGKGVRPLSTFSRVKSISGVLISYQLVTIDEFVDVLQHGAHDAALPLCMDTLSSKKLT